MKRYKLLFSESFYKGDILDKFDIYLNPTPSELVKLIKSAKENDLPYPRKMRGIMDVDSEDIYVFNTEFLHYQAIKQIKGLGLCILFQLNLDTKRIEIYMNTPGADFTETDVEILADSDWVKKNRFKVIPV